jgi:hypothetical protein
MAVNALTRTVLDLSATLTSIAVQQKPRVHVCSRRFYTDRLTGKATMSAVVLVAGQTYEITERELSQLQDGFSPADLDLAPLEDE